MNTINYRYCGHINFTLLIICLFVTAYCFLSLIEDRSSLVDWVGVTVFGYVTINSVIKLSNNDSILILNNDGINDKRLKIGTILWEDILDADILEHRNYIWVRLYMLDVIHKKYLNRCGFFHKIIFRIYKFIFKMPIFLPITELDAEAKSILNIILYQSKEANNAFKRDTGKAPRPLT